MAQMSNRQNLRKTRVVGSGLGMFKFQGEIIFFFPGDIHIYIYIYIHILLIGEIW